MSLIKKYDQLLVSLAGSMSKGDYSTITFVLRDYVTNSEFNAIDQNCDLIKVKMFEIYKLLENKQLLSNDLLKDLFKSCNREDLVRKVEEYERTNNQALPNDLDNIGQVHRGCYPGNSPAHRPPPGFPIQGLLPQTMYRHFSPRFGAVFPLQQQDNIPMPNDPAIVQAMMAPSQAACEPPGQGHLQQVPTYPQPPLQLVGTPSQSPASPQHLGNAGCESPGSGHLQQISPYSQPQTTPSQLVATPPESPASPQHLGNLTVPSSSPVMCTSPKLTEPHEVTGIPSPHTVLQGKGAEYENSADETDLKKLAGDLVEEQQVNILQTTNAFLQHVIDLRAQPTCLSSACDDTVVMKVPPEPAVEPSEHRLLQLDHNLKSSDSGNVQSDTSSILSEHNRRRSKDSSYQSNDTEPTENFSDEKSIQYSMKFEDKENSMQYLNHVVKVVGPPKEDLVTDAEKGSISDTTKMIEDLVMDAGKESTSDARRMFGKLSPAAVPHMDDRVTKQPVATASSALPSTPSHAADEDKSAEVTVHKRVEDSKQSATLNPDKGLKETNGSKKEQIHADVATQVGTTPSLRVAKTQMDLLNMKLYAWEQKEKIVELYAYQKELAAPALGNHNSIICAPTGSGKTSTAAYVCKDKYMAARAQGVPFKALFVVSITNLISQQQAAIRLFLGEGEDKRGPTVCGIKETTDVRSALEEYDIVVVTAEILVNCMKSERGEMQMQFDDFDLLILDECHHTIEPYAYNEIIDLYQKAKRRPTPPRLPQIVGLTTSLGVGPNEDGPQENYILMCAKLDCNSVTHVCDMDNYNDLIERNPKPTRDQIVSVKGRDKDDKFVLTVIGLMKEVFQQSPLHRARGTSPQHGTLSYENWCVQRRHDAEQSDHSGSATSILATQVLQCLNSALMFYDEVQAKDIVPWMKKTLNSLVGLTEQKLYTCVDAVWDTLGGLAETEQLSQNPKLEKLVALLEELYLNKPESKGLLLIKRPFSVAAITTFIKNCLELQGLVYPDRLVGEGGDELTLTDDPQEVTVNRLHPENSDTAVPLNLLVTTDAAQEGLDMPKCDFVIRYNFEIGAAKSHGWARAQNSKCYLIIVNSGSVAEREFRHLEREHVTIQALSDMDRLPEGELKDKIQKKQDQLKPRDDKLRSDALRPLIASARVTIHCKRCEHVLAAAGFLRMRGRYYIVADPYFINKVTIREVEKKEDTRHYIKVGSASCNNDRCNNPLGPSIQYKKGSRDSAVVALSADHVVYQIKNQAKYWPITQWSKVPFEITTEGLTD